MKSANAILLNKALTIFIALVWLVNGLFCKVLNLVPRHGQIVAAILGVSYANTLTVLIGLAELVMVVWIISGYRPRLCAVMQIMVVLMMNVLEIALVPQLLLFGPYNGLFALLFIGLVYINGFILPKQTQLA